MLTEMLKNMKQLRKLNISGNPQLQSRSVREIIVALQEAKQLQEVDLSKLKMDGANDQCYRELGELILKNRSLKTLNMQKVNATDSQVNFLIEPLVRAQNVENINLSFNRITGLFLEKYCKKVSMIGYTQSRDQGLDRNASSSLLASESEDNFSNANAALSGRQGSALHQGLISLSLEGNEIGDKGADAIA